MARRLAPALTMLGLLAIGVAVFRLEPADRPDARDPSVSTMPSQGVVRAVQVELALRGFDPGFVDGIAGQQTRAAIRAYRVWAGAPADDAVTDALRRNLQHRP